MSTLFVSWFICFLIKYLNPGCIIEYAKKGGIYELMY